MAIPLISRSHFFALRGKKSDNYRVKRESSSFNHLMRGKKAQSFNHLMRGKKAQAFDHLMRGKKAQQAFDHLMRGKKAQQAFDHLMRGKKVKSFNHVMRGKKAQAFDHLMRGKKDEVPMEFVRESRSPVGEDFQRFMRADFNHLMRGKKSAAVWPANAANAANVDYYDEAPAKVGDETVEDDGDEDSSYEEYVWGTPEYL